MIAVHLNKTWPHVQAKHMTPEHATLGAWPIAEENLRRYGDVLLGVHQNTVVVAYDITGHTRDDDKKVTFTGKPSSTWAHLVGQPTPAKPWGAKGDAWPVRFVDTVVVAGGDVPVEENAEGRRAVIDDVVLTVGADQQVVVVVPPGRSITVRTTA
ncbi:hypothetical protein ACWEVP_37320 [Amycolatopsis sp. NPDC003865]